MSSTSKMKRCCANCEHFIPPEQAKEHTDDGRGVCFEGGFSEIGDPYRERTEEDCNAFRPKMLLHNKRGRA